MQHGERNAGAEYIYQGNKEAALRYAKERFPNATKFQFNKSAPKQLPVNKAV
jgi:hypothetical protein